MPRSRSASVTRRARSSSMSARLPISPCATESCRTCRMSSVLEDLAAIALALGQARSAARLLGAAEAIREAIGTVIAPCERPQHLQAVAAARAALGEEAFAAARQHGMLATTDEL